MERLKVLERRRVEVCDELPAVEAAETSVEVSDTPEVTVSAEIVLKIVITSVDPDNTCVETTLTIDAGSVEASPSVGNGLGCADTVLEIVRTVVEPKATRVDVATATSEDIVLSAKVVAPELEVSNHPGDVEPPKVLDSEATGPVGKLLVDALVVVLLEGGGDIGVVPTGVFSTVKVVPCPSTKLVIVTGPVYGRDVCWLDAVVLGLPDVAADIGCDGKP